MFAKCPAGQPGAADEVASAAELLMSEKGAFITGSTILIDGGAAEAPGITKKGVLHYE